MNSVSPQLPQKFLPFASALKDPSAVDLALRTLGWAQMHGVLAASGHPHPEALVVVASVYAHLCAPHGPSPRSLDVAARFTLLFFYIDDASPESLQELAREGSDWSAGPLTDGLRAWLAELPQLASCPRSLRESFTTSFHDYIRARRLEPSLHSGELSLGDHWSLRRRTIFMDPYIDQWMISTGIDTDRFHLHAFADARRLATDIVLLSNDLGSVGRDRKDGDAPEDLNLVTAYERARGWPHSEALEKLIDHHNELVSTYRGAVHAAKAGEASSHADAYADLLTGVVDGNLASLHTLDFRYRGVAAILARLERVA